MRWPDAAPALASGPRVARLYHALYGLCMAAAWASFAVQARVLIGSDGLQPLQAWVDRLAARGVGFSALPMIFWAGVPSDAGLVALCWLGGILSLVAAAGVLSRPLFLISALLYLSVANGGGTFMSFQWDNLAVECGLLAALLPRDRAAFWPHLMGRALLFKVFFESAIAKLQSPLGDWIDGSAMTLYYQTAPLPTGLAWRFHHLPTAWHHLESWWTLCFEGVLVFGIWAGRIGRRVALACFAGFLILDAATANYGFFVHLTAALCVFLLSEEDVARLGRRLPARPSWPRLELPPGLERGLGGVAVSAWLAVSVAAGLAQLGERPVMPAVVEAVDGWRVANVYHLFSAITRERIEPEFQTWDGRDWTARDLRYKPGAVTRAPPFVAPHQPRVDFRLWFYGLSYRRGAPSFVGALLTKLCADPGSVAELFAEPLPDAPKAVRIQFWNYVFTSSDQRDATGAWWDRTLVETSEALPCAR